MAAHKADQVVGNLVSLLTTSLEVSVMAASCLYEELEKDGGEVDN